MFFGRPSVENRAIDLRARTDPQESIHSLALTRVVMLDEESDRVIEATWWSTVSPSDTDTGIDVLAAQIREELQHDDREPK
jgi:hypothetical protein